MVFVVMFLCGLENFFSNRTHQTRVGEYLSAVANLLSGVIQGSGIGPVMFLIYIDELAKLLESNGITAKLFADDVKVYVAVLNIVDACKLQTALDLIVDWAEAWQLQLSVTKCSILNVGPAPVNVNYHIHDAVLKCSDKCLSLIHI